LLKLLTFFAGLDPIKRAKLTGIQVRTMRRIVKDEKYPAWRADALSEHSRSLRHIVGPLLDIGAERYFAGRAIGAIVVSAWDLSTLVFTSNFTFIFSYPKIGDRFIHPTLECVDPAVEETAGQLHLRQAKIKLVVTPSIIMRNDRNMAINAKQVTFGRVLIFP
jgi:hypothetical protein